MKTEATKFERRTIMTILTAEQSEFLCLIEDIHVEHPKSIKVTSKFGEWIEARANNSRLKLESIDTTKGYIASYQGIPIEIDDTIENEYYELVY
jgi:hypothetical protein